MNLPSLHAASARQDYPDGWAPGELAPPRRPRGRARWLIALAALVTAIAVCGAFVLVDDAGTDAASDTSAAAIDNPAPLDAAAVASAGDTGPLTLVTEDPTCPTWNGVAGAVAEARGTDWDTRASRVPATSWTPGQRTRFTAVGNALRTAADTAVHLAVQTPHRAVRGLYEAFVVYGRAYADSLLNYRPDDDFLAQTSLAAAEAITRICAASESRAASSQAGRLTPVAPPTARPLGYTPTAPKRFLPQPNRVCGQWVQDRDALLTRLRGWSALDPKVSVGSLTDAQVLVYADTARTVTQFAERMETAGRSSGNPVVEDFATLAALYFRAYSRAVSLVWPGAHDMVRVGFAITDLVAAGCGAAAT